MISTDTKEAGELIKGVGELIKSVGPTDEHRQGFGRSFLGTLLGQTVAMLGMLAMYLVVVATTWRYFSGDLRALHEFSRTSFWLVILTPLFSILFFSMVPTGLRAWREYRMRITLIGGTAKFDAFRLYPYAESDRSDFKRLDGADKTLLAWLTSAKSSVLYFSGASGVGKSSLLAASLLPQLRDREWLIVETRLFENPIESLRTALVSAIPRLARKNYSDRSLRDLLQIASDKTDDKDPPPLLLVIDQFEEFLVLHEGEERANFIPFLVELTKNPIDGVKLLLVFRSDYRPLIFKLDLPPLSTGENWYELSAYNRGEAIAFLEDRRRELASTAIDRLFRGLDRIEDAPGMYRLITLNMVGLVLERMGTTLEGDPGRLIQSYLTDCLRYGESRDYARDLLGLMISDAGTKVPRTEQALVDGTHFAHWQVKATLAELARQGLVRRLGKDSWEISHDFLARVIGQLVGRLRPNILQRVQPFVAPVVLLGWIGFGALAWPYFGSIQQRTTEEALRQLGATIGGSKWGGLEVHWTSENEDLSDALPHLAKIRSLSLSFPTFLGLPRYKLHLEQLSHLSNLVSLDLTGAYGISSLEPLKGLTNLRELHLSRVGDVTSLEPLRNMHDLTELDLSDEVSISNLEPLRELKNLLSLKLAGTGITHLDPLRDSKSLQTLDLTNTHLSSLEPLKDLKKLRVLNLHGTSVDLEPIRFLTGLSTLDLSDTTYNPGMGRISELTELRELDLSGVSGLTSLEFIRHLRRLTSLNVGGNPAVMSLDPIKDLTELTSLKIVGANRISDLEPLRYMTKLTALEISDAPNISNLEPLRDLTKLTSLTIAGTSVMNLLPLRQMTELTSLNLSKNPGVDNLEPLKDMIKLRDLDISELTRVTSLEPLRRMINLSVLDIAHDISITTLEPLRDMNLYVIDITAASGITNMDPLKGKSVKITNDRAN